MLFAALALAAVEAPPPRPITVEVVRDAITDSVSASATLLDAGQRLTLSCDRAEHYGVRVSFSSPHWMARGSFFSPERPIVYRFDSQRPRRHIWDVRDRGAILAGRSRVGRFLHGLITAERLVIRARDVEDHPFDLSFRISGASAAVRELLEACGETRLRTRLYGPA
ncbi:MAG TPA: hypothetical protein VES64_10980 [Allosphingosinicella sp.]|nr:hypothetical protein [Allosphingosinicella sp.]